MCDCNSACDGAVFYARSSSHSAGGPCASRCGRAGSVTCGQTWASRGVRAHELKTRRCAPAIQHRGAGQDRGSTVRADEALTLRRGRPPARTCPEGAACSKYRANSPLACRCPSVSRPSIQPARRAHRTATCHDRLPSPAGAPMSEAGPMVTARGQPKCGPPAPGPGADPRFSSSDYVPPGLLYAWERDADDIIWRAQVWCVRETAPRIPGHRLPRHRPRHPRPPRNTTTNRAAAIDGPQTQQDALVSAQQRRRTAHLSPDGRSPIPRTRPLNVSAERQTRPAATSAQRPHWRKD